MMVDGIPGMVAVANAQGVHEYANQRTLDFVGKNLAEVTGDGWISTIHPDERAGVRDQWLQCNATGTPMDMHHRLLRHDGAYRLVHARIEPAISAEGKIMRWYALLTDVEDRAKAEEALRASEQSFRLMVDTIPGFISVWSPTGEVEIVSKQTLDYLGVSNFR